MEFENGSKIAEVGIGDAYKGRPRFDPEKVDRFVGSDSFSDEDCVWASDYDKLLALYNLLAELHRITESYIDNPVDKE